MINPGRLASALGLENLLIYKTGFDTVWIDGLLYKLFNDLGIKGRMWLAIKDLYTDVKAQVLYSGELSREFDVSQGTGQGRIFAPFMYKVYINSLLQKLSNHCYAISINSLSLPAPVFCRWCHFTCALPFLPKDFFEHLSPVQCYMERRI